MKIKVAITSQNKRTVTKHAGECRNFLIYTIEDEKVISKEIMTLEANRTLKYTFHEDPSEIPFNPVYDMDILLSGSIGRSGVNKLAMNNVAAYVIQEKDPDVAIEKLLNGTLEAFEPVSHRHQHNHDQHKHHHHQHEHSHGGGGCGGGNCGHHH